MGNFGNIWQWMQRKFSSLGVEDWGILLKTDGKLIRCSGKKRPFIASDEADGINFGEVGKVVTPVFLGESQIFSLLLVESEIKRDQAEDIAVCLGGMLLLERSFYNKTPSFFPFYLPMDENGIFLNDQLCSDRRLFFLNGQAGTGKKTFIWKHLCYHNLDPMQLPDSQEQNFLQKGSDYVIIHELALLELNEQSRLLELLQAEEVMFCYVCSRYGLDALREQGLVVEELYALMNGSRIVFPALHRRGEIVFKELAFQFDCKGVQIPAFVANSWFNKVGQRIGYDEYIADMELLREIEHPLFDIQDNLDLRLQIGEYENKCIGFAQRIVGSSQNKIARMLGISRGSLQHKLKKYNYPYSEWEE